jgi:zinc transport system ATP-binding protein
MSDQPVIQLENVSFRYDKIDIIERANLIVHEREFVWVVGPNGGGKTTLTKLILGLLTPYEGSVTLLGTSPQKVQSAIGYVPQHASVDISFPISVLDMTLIGRLRTGLLPRRYSRSDRELAIQALEHVGLEEMIQRPIGQLSGGQQRRLLIARALATDPKILLLDEPTANLDAGVARDVYALLEQLNDKLTIVMVSHDPAFVSGFVEEVVCVDRSVHVHPTSEIKGRPVDALWTRLVKHDQHGACDHD